jgi:tetratricopeptide (TPR) repeat protein
MAEKRCAVCNKALPPDANFCSGCGSRVATGERSVFDEMIDDFRRTLETEPDNVDARHNLALCYLRAGQDDLALIELERVRIALPDFADAYYHLARIHHRRGDDDRARELLATALEIEPNHAEAKRLQDTLSTG